MRRFFTMIALCALTACGRGAETHLLTLGMAPPVAAPAPYNGSALRVSAVQIPPSLDRLDFASAVSPTELHVQDQYRWSASLGSLAREALVRDLAVRLPPGTVLAPDSPAAKGTRRVDVAILGLTTLADSTSMEVLITLAQDGTPQVLRRQSTLTRRHVAGQTPAQAAADYSAMLGEVADQIVMLTRQTGT